MQRRTFLMTTAAAQMRILGANDRLRAGIIGSGGRGRYLIGQFKEVGAELAAVCDVYEPNLQAGVKEASTGARPFRDYRRLLDEKSIDVVIVATPDHWHARMVIDAVEAGKDVYVGHWHTRSTKGSRSLRRWSARDALFRWGHSAAARSCSWKPRKLWRALKPAKSDS